MGNFINELKNYQTIPRELIFDKSLSDRARFVFCFMASKPDDWEFLLTPMAKEIGYTVETLRKYIKELVEHGWLEKGEQKNDKRFGAVSYTLKASVSKKQSSEKADTEKTRHGNFPTQTDNIYTTDNILDSVCIDNDKKDNLSFLEKNEKFVGAAENSSPSDLFEDVWLEWCEYAKEQHNIKSRMLKCQRETLIEYTHGDAALAKKIIKRAINNGFKMFVPPKDEDNITEKDPNQKWE